MIESRLGALVDGDDDSVSSLPVSLDRQEVQLDLYREVLSKRQADKFGRIQMVINEGDKKLSKEVDELEPLGYQHFLCDVNIEYSPGGHLDCSASSNRHSFRLKYLPYMVSRYDLNHQQPRKASLTSSSSSIYEQQQLSQDDESILDLKHIDVTKATCAFLSNSDYVPCNRSGRRRVVLELISAKLSQSSSSYVPANSSYTSLVALEEQSLQTPNSSSSDAFTSPNSPNRFDQNRHSNSPSTPSSSALTSKRFVNYTILLKTLPGLDKHPAVIERRFSDFLLLYQSLKWNKSFAGIIDSHVTFPKKVYVGNFSLSNIAERSIEFSRLLSLCMTNYKLLWSDAFISFLLDKELKEAHRLSLCGDPDDVQSLIENAYHILKKLFLNEVAYPSSGDSSNNNNADSLQSISLPDTNGTNTSGYDQGSPVLSNGQSSSNSSSINETISAASSSSNHDQLISADHGLSPNQSGCESANDESEKVSPSKKANCVMLNQRILVTFCMLFLTYYRGENYGELKLAVQSFNQLISSQEYVDSMINTRHYMTLRACLLFLMNMNRGNVIDENQRIWLKRKLEEIDGSHADLNNSSSSMQIPADNNSYSSSPGKVMKHSGNSNDMISVHRVTKGDLTSLIRDKNFCTFQDRK